MAFDLKNEEEVKEYLENLGTEYRFGCFSEKKPEVCHLLGDFMESIKKDFPRAAKLYKSTCDDYHYTRSCYKYALYSLTGKGCEVDNNRALQYFKKGCEFGDRDCCLYTGLMLVAVDEKNIPVKRDYKAGMAFLKQACEAGSDNGCFYLSGLYLGGVPGFLEPDMKIASQLSQRGCELGNIFACANLSRMYARGDGVDKDEALAAKYKAKAMDLEKQLKANFRPVEMQQTTGS